MSPSRFDDASNVNPVKILAMKKLLLFCGMAVLIMASCKKEDTEYGTTVQIEYPASALVIRDAVTDIDGNKYDAVRIGEQVWMSMNMRTTHFADGTAIAEGSEISYEDAFRYAPDKPEGIKGYVYNWKAAMHGTGGTVENPSGVQGVCPDGWHLPSEAEWQQLTDYLSSHSEYVCSGTGENVAKSLAYDREWDQCSVGCAVGHNQNDNNATGFSAVPVGYYPGLFTNYGCSASFWSATEVDSVSAMGVNMYMSDSLVHRTICNKVGGFSVRCVRNE
jgi:uncharacterized protein (TIGR02145 family)